MRAAIYARRSTDEHQAASLDVQQGEAKAFIENIDPGGDLYAVRDAMIDWILKLTARGKE